MRHSFCFGVSGFFSACFLLFSSSLINAMGRVDGNVYGRANVSYQLEDHTSGGSVWKLANNASRLGFKGESDIGDDLALIYQIEYGVEIDDGDKNGQTVSQRDSFVGLQGLWGRIKGGRITIPFKESKGPVDRFNDLQGELGKILDGEERVSNVLQYDSHTLFGPLVATLAIVPGENINDDEEDGPADGISGSLVYSNNQLYLGFGFNSDIKQQDQWRFTGAWLWPMQNNTSLSVGALYQGSKINGDENSYIDGEDETDAYGFSTAYKFRKNTIKAQYLISDRSISLSDASQFSLAIEHKLGKDSTLFSYYTHRSADEAEQKNHYLAVGLKHYF